MDERRIIASDAARRGAVEMLTVAEAAQALGLTRTSVRDAIHQGKLAHERAVSPGQSPLRPIFLIPRPSVEEYRATYLRKKLWNRRHDPEETRRMREAGYLTIGEVAREVGVNAPYLSRLVHTGKIAGVIKHIAFIHRDVVAALKAERERKMVALGIEQPG